MPTHISGSASFASGGIFFHGVRADPSDIADIRRSMQQWLGNLHLGPEHEQDVVLASYEALANAVEHAYAANDPQATVDLEAVYRPSDRHLEVTVSDHGRWRDVMDRTGYGSRGHGLTLMRSLSTEMVVTPGLDGTHVAMRWSL
ncbi:ATP-binding protein [Rhodococcus artemisiae]|uniref:ATP-binding protein n=1 Tax=Rhodococcus artemisiae TaxID=714159 RepID=A0ABU7L592_9NOCA|nr:ATP-binding protein [Rhodococcus artemisiae]MEE2056704.1 ATP-binding protein [Rhodococcus artemisiae]